MFIEDNHALEITEFGTIKLKMYNATICTIQKVRHVNGVKKNLLSLDN